MGSPVQMPVTLGPAVDDHGRRLCPRQKVSKLLARKVAGQPLLPVKFLERLEHDQKLAHCCRHPENHDIEGLKSNPAEAAIDVYIFHCSCGRQHRRLMVGGGPRPVWHDAA